MEWLWEWLKQPSSLRVINFAAAGLGWVIAPELWQEIIGVAAAVYIIIDGFYNKQPRK